MPWNKETAKAMSKKGHKAKAENRDNFWAFMASGGLRAYMTLMEKLARDEPIGTNQKEFMDRSEKTFPYLKARKTDITSGGEKLPMPIYGGQAL
jgi:hypothetical protein